MLRSVAYARGVSLDLGAAVVSACAAGHAPVVAALTALGAGADNVMLGQMIDQLLWLGHAEVVEALLAAGAWVDVRDHPMLVSAATRGCSALVQRLLAEGRYPVKLLSRSLSHACENGHVSVIRALLAAEPASAPADGAGELINTTLRGGHAAAAMLLTELLEVPLRVEGEALRAAAEGGCVEMVEEALLTQQTPEDLSGALSAASAPAVVRLLLDAKACVADTDGGSVLSAACQRHQPESVQMLLAAGARVHSHASSLLAATLGSVARGDHAPDQAAVVRLLLAATPPAALAGSYEALFEGACVSAALTAVLAAHDPAALRSRLASDAALAHAVDQLDVPLAQALLDAGAAVDARDGDGRSALARCIQGAARPGPWAPRVWERRARATRTLVRLLLAAGAAIRAVGGGGGATLIMLLLSPSRGSPQNLHRTDCLAAALIRDIGDAVLMRAARGRPEAVR